MLFGPERSGLDNDVIALADAILTAPVNPEFASLSLPQAVLLFGYEWLKAPTPRLRSVASPNSTGQLAEGIAFTDTRPATREELFGLFQHLEDELDRTGFLYPLEKRAINGAQYPQHVPPHGGIGARCAHVARDRRRALTCPSSQGR